MIAEKTLKKGVAYGLPPNKDTFLASAQEIQTIFAKGLNEDGSYKPETVLALLKFRRVNVTAFAELNGYDESYFRKVISRECRDVNVENIIADKLGVAADRMWGRCMLCEVGNAS